MSNQKKRNLKLRAYHYKENDIERSIYQIYDDDTLEIIDTFDTIVYGKKAYIIARDKLKILMEEEP